MTKLFIFGFVLMFRIGVSVHSTKVSGVNVIYVHSWISVSLTSPLSGICVVSAYSRIKVSLTSHLSRISVVSVH